MKRILGSMLLLVAVVMPHVLGFSLALGEGRSSSVKEEGPSRIAAQVGTTVVGTSQGDTSISGDPFPP